VTSLDLSKPMLDLAGGPDTEDGVIAGAGERIVVAGRIGLTPMGLCRGVKPNQSTSMVVEPMSVMVMDPKPMMQVKVARMMVIERAIVESEVPSMETTNVPSVVPDVASMPVASTTTTSMAAMASLGESRKRQGHS